MHKVIHFVCLAAALLVFSSPPAAAQEDGGTHSAPGCADHGVSTVQHPAQVSPSVSKCDTGFAISVDGITIVSDSAAGCPDWTTQTPAFQVPDASVSLPGQEPCKRAERVYELKQSYKCVDLFLYTVCAKDGEEIAVGNGYDDWTTCACQE